MSNFLQALGLTCLATILVFAIAAVVARIAAGVYNLLEPHVSDKNEKILYWIILIPVITVMYFIIHMTIGAIWRQYP